MAQQPVPGIMVSAGTPASTRASINWMRSLRPKELASPVVPSTARPSQPLASSQRQCRAMRATSGDRSLSCGVSTAAKTPA